MSLEKDITEVRRLVEQDEPVFKAASPEQIDKRRTEADKKHIAWVRSLPRVKLYALCSDQMDAWVDKNVGEFYYDDENDGYFDDAGVEVTRDDIRDEYAEANSVSMHGSCEIFDRESLESLGKSINDVLMVAPLPPGRNRP
jgi:hypothetical protein